MVNSASTVDKDKDKIVEKVNKSPLRERNRNILKKSSSTNKSVINSNYAILTNLKESSNKRSINYKLNNNNNDDSHFRERDVRIEHNNQSRTKTPLEKENKCYKWEIVYKKEDTSPLNNKDKSGYIKKKGNVNDLKIKRK